MSRDEDKKTNGGAHEMLSLAVQEVESYTGGSETKAEEMKKFQENLNEHWMQDVVKRLAALEQKSDARIEIDKLHTKLLLGLAKTVGDIRDGEQERDATLKLLVERLGGL